MMGWQSKVLSHVRVGLLALLLAGHLPVQAADNYPAVQVLLETDRTVTGELLRHPDQSAMQVQAAVVEIAPGKSTGWHRHGVPMFAYLLSGELEVEYASGQRSTLKAGDALMEAMRVPHIGSNLGTQPARVLTLFMDRPGVPRTIREAAPAVPPAVAGATRQPDLVDLARFDPRLQFDIRYATDNNFMGQVLYPAARALLQRPAAEALRRVHDRLQAQGYGLIVLDAYRPWQVTRSMWDSHPHDRAYLADPLQGSRHNRGSAIDVSLYDRQSGAAISMPSAYDDFSERAHPDYSGGSAAQRAARDLLRAAMEREGFSVYPNEWWHFDYAGWEQWPVMNLPLDVSLVESD